MYSVHLFNQIDHTGVMRMLEEMTTLDIDEIQYDYENPRIKGALEKYGDNLTPERIHFALQSSSDGENPVVRVFET